MGRTHIKNYKIIRSHTKVNSFTMFVMMNVCTGKDQSLKLIQAKHKHSVM